MPKIIVNVLSTVGPTIGSDDPQGPESVIRDQPATWPASQGAVRETLDDDGEPAEALVLMRNPARRQAEPTAQSAAADQLPSEHLHTVIGRVSKAEADLLVGETCRALLHRTGCLDR